MAPKKCYLERLFIKQHFTFTRIFQKKEFFFCKFGIKLLIENTNH